MAWAPNTYLGYYVGNGLIGGSTDDYGDDVGFLEFDLHIQIDSLGSDAEYVKQT